MFDDELITFVAEHSATSGDGNHLVQMDHSHFIRSDGQIRSLQQASAMLATGEWGSVVPTCGVEDCIRPDHMEAAELVMVAQATAPTLADLYRKAKSRGLVTAQTSYGG